MRALIQEADDLLRAEGRHALSALQLPWLRLAFLVIAGGFCFGASMGCFGGRGLQAVYSAAKMPFLISGATLVCVPFFFVVNVLLGLARDFPAAMRGVMSSQATVAICLAAMAPVTLFFYASGADYPTALLLNGFLFALASLGGQITLARHYKALIARDPQHRVALVAWLILYVFVSVKVGSILRPFVGDPTAPTQLFRATAFEENPYSSLYWSAYWILHK